MLKTGGERSDGRAGAGEPRLIRAGVLRAAGAHPRIVALLAAAAVALSLLTVAAVRSRDSAGCGEPPPRPDLPARLRSLGGFDQPYDARQTRTLQDAAQQAAASLHPDLGASTVAGAPVALAAVPPARYDAVVVPLGTDVGPNGRPRAIAGLVAFLRDCSGQAYYDDVRDLVAAPPPAFPEVDAARAAALLGSARARLVYTDSPFAPRWQDPATQRTVDAQPAPGRPPA